MLHRARSTLSKGPRRSDLRRVVRPDVVFTRARLAVFVDGCFWHCCPVHGNQPRANTDYWGPKLERNVHRDRAVDCALDRELDGQWFGPGSTRTAGVDDRRRIEMRSARPELQLGRQRERRSARVDRARAAICSMQGAPRAEGGTALPSWSCCCRRFPQTTKSSGKVISRLTSATEAPVLPVEWAHPGPGLTLDRWRGPIRVELQQETPVATPPIERGLRMASLLGEIAGSCRRVEPSEASSA